MNIYVDDTTIYCGSSKPLDNENTTDDNSSDLALLDRWKRNSLVTFNSAKTVDLR